MYAAGGGEVQWGRKTHSFGRNGFRAISAEVVGQFAGQGINMRSSQPGFLVNTHSSERKMYFCAKISIYAYMDMAEIVDMR